MNEKKPLKRHLALKELSKEHYQGLVLCVKIRKGLKNNIEIERMKIYINWFYKNHLIPHFEMEEKQIFPILGNEHPLIQQALNEHQRLQHLFEDRLNILNSLNFIEKELESHIRFEERILFQEIQKVATEEQLIAIERLHKNEKFVDNLTDVFWE